MRPETLDFHPRAAEEFEAAVAFSENRRPGLGRQLRDAVAETVNAALVNPDGDAPGDAGTRFRLVPRFRFVVHHLVVDEVLWMVAVAHGHRRPDYWHDRLDDVTD